MKNANSLVPTRCMGTRGLCTIAAAVVAVSCIANATCFAGEQSAPAPERSIYVPFSDLHVILQQQPKRVLLSREEYEDLLKKAKKTPETHAPQAALIVSANYEVTAVSQRAEIRGVLAIDVLESGLHALPLDLGGVGLQDATLDKRDASLGRDVAGRLVLFVEGIGRHELRLDMVAPLETTAARQVLTFRLPHPPAAKLRLAVSGDVEVKGGADVISRSVDAAAKVTRFELLPRQGDTSLVMTLNSHLQRQDRAVVARSVLIDEVTQAYEKLYATVSLGILYRAVDQFSFIVPEGFEISEVTSPLLARWDVRREGGRKVLGVKLREQTTETVVLKVAAVHTPARLDGWSAPRLDPLDVVGSVAVVGLLVEDRLKAESLATRGLIPVDTAVLTDVLPPNLLSGEPGQAALRAVAAWYAPQSDYALTAQYKKPPAEMAVTTSLLLVVADKGQEVLGGLAFLPQVERRFWFDISLPDGWQIVAVTTADGQPLPFEHYADGVNSNSARLAPASTPGAPRQRNQDQTSAPGRVRVTVPGGMAVGQEYKVNFRAVRIPKGWLAEWKSAAVEFPKFAVLDATHDVGAVAVDVRDDLAVRPEKLSQLVPLDAGDKPKYGLAGVSTRLAYRYDSPKYAASIAVERTRPRLTARTFSFVRVEPSALDCHYELIYKIAAARTQKLAFLLPKDTPASISIAALDGVTIKESNPEVVGGQRRWTVSLAEPAGDHVRLAVAFQQPLAGDATVSSGAAVSDASGGQETHAAVALPIIVADDVAYQSGLVGVEGCAELEVNVVTPARQVDVDELADARYQPGRWLLGAFAFVGDPPAVKIDVMRHAAYRLYPAIVQECELDTNLSPDGQSETQARFKLLTKAMFLQVKLPAKGELWSAELDGTPLKPQRQGDSLLIDVPAGRGDAPQTLQIVYAAKVAPVGSRGTVAVPAPKLLLRSEQKGTPVEVPLVDLVWRLHLPGGYDVVGTGGTVATDELKLPPPAAVQVARFLLGWNDDLSHFGLLGAASQRARESARRVTVNNNLEQIGMALHNYGQASNVFPPNLSPPVHAARVAELDRLIAEKTAQLNAKRAELKSLVGTVSGSDSPGALSSKQRLVLEELSLYRQESAKIQTALESARAELTKQEAASQADVSAGDSAAANRHDSEAQHARATVRSLEAQLESQKQRIGKRESEAKQFGQTAVDLTMQKTVLDRLNRETADLAKLRGELRELAVPGEEPIVYPDAEWWQKMTVRHKDSYSSMDLAKAPSKAAPAAEAKPEALYSPSRSESAMRTKEPGAGGSYPVADLVIPLPPTPNEDLSGTRSLKIDVLQTPPDADDVLTFRSLGVDPELAVTLANHQRLSALGWGLAMIVGLVGVAITRRPVRAKMVYILAVAVAATIVPLITGGIEIVYLCNMLFYAACWLIPYYLAAGAVRAVWRLHLRAFPSCAANVAGSAAAKPAAMLLIAVAVAGINALAKPQAAFGENPESAGGRYVVQVVEPPAPVNVPEDAVILPYDPDWQHGPKDADRVLVPYERYVELWNRVHPDKRIETKAPPAPYALAGAAYKTLLDGDDYLLLTGQLQIDVFSDDFAQIPLGLGGGVLAQAELDGKPARLSAAPAQPLAASQPSQSPSILYVSGKGRHKLDVAVRLKLSRQGGWRVVQGVLPTAAASSLSINVPNPHTELRLGEVLDRRKYDTEKADETIRTALGPGGAVSLQWRPAVAEGQIDRSLTAVSNAVFDVQEDGLRLTWQLGLEFRGGQREQFRVNLPAGYLLEKVEGSNVRGWELRKSPRGESVEVTLLQPAKDYERFTLRLWRSGPVGQKGMAQFDVPQVSVSDAALHTGQLTIRRSPLLELRTLDRSGVTRTDLPGGDANAGGIAGVEESPLGIQPCEAYTFAAVPFSLRLSAAPISARVSASVQTVLKLAEFERNLESNVNFDVQGRRVYQLRMLLPDGLRLDRVLAPGAYDYAVTKQGKRSLLTVYLADGQEGNVSVRIRGQFGGEGALAEVPLPRLDVLDVGHQQGDVAVQVDPAFDVEAVNLANCEPILLGQLATWLNPEQQRVTRLGLHYRQGGYSGTLLLRLRKPEVTCDTISNVRVTDRALEETILLDFNIQRAGIRRLSFLLPATMADSQISVEKLRQKTVEPVGKEAGSPLRVTIELQDEEMGQLHVLVENDRLLTPGSHDVPIPTIETGRAASEKGDSPHLPERPEGGFAQMGTVPFFRMGRRYAVIENAGRDEVVVEPKNLREMERLSNRQKEWATLRGILGREMTMVYLAAADAREPRLAFDTESQAAVTTVKARIGLSETRLVIDGNGAYRGQVTLWMDNATEQFLEIRLPEGARLWAARVAGEAVKPTNPPGAAGPRSVRIPLIKTARGDLYYEVVLKYGGKMPAFAAVGSAEFPLIRCMNITPDLSQVRLYVPADHQWFDFAGTMRLAEEADLRADYLKFQTKQAEQNFEALQRGDKWTKSRAENSLKTQQGLMQNFRSSVASEGSNPNLQSELFLNDSIDKRVTQELAKQEKAPAEGEIHYNRDRLNLAYQAQRTSRARNVVNDVGNNWGDTVEQQQAANSSGQFNGEWMRQNNFRLQTEGDKSGEQKAGDMLGKGPMRLFRAGDKSEGEMVTRGRVNINTVQQPSYAQVLQVTPQATSQMGGFGPGGFGGNAQGQRGPNGAEGYLPHEEGRNRQMILGGEYSRSMADLKSVRPGQLQGAGGFPPAPPAATPAAPLADGQPAGPAKVAHEATVVPEKPAPQSGEAVLPGLTAATTAANATAVQQANAGLASLDFELPATDASRWTLYRFTTPRGDEQITARSIANDLVLRLVEIVVAAAALLVLWAVVQIIRRGRFDWLATPIAAAVLISLGVISLCGGLLPIIGVVALVAGCAVLVQRWTSPTTKPLAASQQPQQEIPQR
ncbi:MAG: DUF1559 domain-containing protein [Thermoguttaceae bacterium]